MNIKNLGRGTHARVLLAGTGVLVAVAVAGCSGSLTGSGQVSPGQTTNGQAPTTTSSPAGGAYTGTGSTSGGTTTGGTGGTSGGATSGGTSGGSGNTVAVAHPPVTPECKASTLALSFGGSDAGMSQQEQVLRFTNTGKKSCVIVGFPGVSYVTGDSGRQVGAPAVRTGKIGAQITLKPGTVASTVIHSVEVGVFDPKACQSTPVRGYRIYAPDDRAAMFIPLPAGVRGCLGKTPDPQLSVITIRAGAGNPDQQ
ncbi:MAG TPA: DUF4232 domain-containing protein [Pseudonocardiaceae bacterium]|jgi:hypothetical protein|nr:DUF4232 domain-containing protein [Pseudonocardiaceae bacterium]